MKTNEPGGCIVCGRKLTAKEGPKYCDDCWLLDGQFEDLRTVKPEAAREWLKMKLRAMEMLVK